MKKLCTFNFWERSQAAILKEILEQEGIACLVRNEELSTALGEIPFIECAPELWVIDDEVFPRAKMLLEGWMKSSEAPSEPWVCPDCGEKLEGQFGACWKCGKVREER
ncbi:MAG: DUF2007 domain-containing protein [Desulfuromonadales bacterium]|jgi:hypothetical protein